MSKLKLSIQEIYALRNYVDRIQKDKLYHVVNVREAFVHRYNLNQVFMRLEKKMFHYKQNNFMKQDKQYTIHFNEIELMSLSIIFNLVQSDHQVTITQNKILKLIQNTELINILTPKKNTLTLSDYE